MTVDLYPEWPGQVVAVVAGGQSAAAVAPLLQGRCRIIAVNLAFRLVPDADVLYAADSGFWHIYQDARKFPGLKLSCDERAQQYDASIVKVHTRDREIGPRFNRMRFDRRGHIGTVGGNSGGQAVNLAAQFGAAVVLLVGLDYCGSHWHQDHPPALRNPSEKQMREWAAALDLEAEELSARGVRVINLSTRSILRAYPHDDAHRLLLGERSTALST